MFSILLDLKWHMALMRLIIHSQSKYTVSAIRVPCSLGVDISTGSSHNRVFEDRVRVLIKHTGKVQLRHVVLTPDV